MVSERQWKIISELRKENQSVSALADYFQVSRRTINREIDTINNDISGIKIENNEGVLHLNIYSSLELYKMYQSSIPDDISVLTSLLLHKNYSLDDISDGLALPKSRVKECLVKLNLEYGGVLKVVLKQGTGLVLHISLENKIELLANLILNYPELNLNQEVKYIPKLINLTFPTELISKDELKSEYRACKCLNLDLNTIDKYFSTKQKVLEQILSKKKLVQERIENIFLTNGFDKPTPEDMKRIFKHICRETLYPNLILKNKEDIKLYLKDEPVAFDMGKHISLLIHKLMPQINVNTYYLALYVMMSLSHYDKNIYRIIIVSRRRSISAINKMLIEEKINGSKVSIINDITSLKQYPSNFAVVLDSEILNKDNALSKSFDLVISSLITANEIKTLQKILRHKTFDNLIQKMNMHYTYQIKNLDTDFFDELCKFLNLLLDQKLISNIEANALINREQAGNQLIINNYSLPHVISANENEFRLFRAKLKRSVIVNNQFIDNILIVIIGMKVTNKSEIFKYLYDEISKKQS